MLTHKKNEFNNSTRRRFYVGSYLRRLHKSGLEGEDNDNSCVPNYPKPKIPPKSRLHSKKFLAKKLDFRVPDKIREETVINWEQRIDKLEKYFAHFNLPIGSFTLDQCTTISDIPGFIDSHLTYIKTCKRSIVHLPYLERLEKLMEIMKATRSSPS